MALFRPRPQLWVPLVACLTTLGLGRDAALGQVVETAQRVSALGQYAGYSSPTYDGFSRTSMHLEMRDGTRLAADILRPTNGGRVHDEPLPVIWTHHRYQRAAIVADTLRTIADWSGWVDDVMKYGYVVTVVGTRGGGASFGIQPGFFSPEEAGDAYEITEWLAAQPWSDGNIGMFGRSYLGITQYFAAGQKPPHLKAIFPEMASFEWYDFFYPGGVFREDFVTKWSFLTWLLDTSTPFDWYGRPLGRVAPVDGDQHGHQWATAIQDHAASLSMRDLIAPVPYRNSVHPTTGTQIHLERSPWTKLPEIQASGIAMYHLAGWLDMFPRDALLWYRNADNPQKLVIGPWFHSETQGLDNAIEHVRWYDYWLKDIDNGIMDEAPIHYWTFNREGWQSAWEWPIPNQRLTDFHFATGPSRSIDSANDGRLLANRPNSRDASDAFVADYTATIGPSNRWTNGYGGWKGYPDDLTFNDKKGLTYTTAPLMEPVEVTGHPVASVWVETTAEDADIFVYLEEVDSLGRSLYVTEGTLRASHRALATPPYDYLGIPYHRSYDVDALPLSPGEVVELVFDLHPTSYLFRAGSRIRVTVVAADRDNAQPRVFSPAPEIRIHRDADHPSRITVPIIPTAAAR